MSSREDELAAARREMRSTPDFKRDQAESEEMWIQRERARKLEEGHRRPSGHWRFEQIINERGDLVGWTVTFEGKRAGLLVLRGDDIQVFSAADSPNDPDATEIMAAFIKLYPDPHAQRLPSGRRALPEGSPFGPPRDWSEE